jgi:hypothetical protein
MLLLLSALAGAAAFVARSGAMLVRRNADLARAEGIADAAILSTIAALSDDKASRHPLIDGAPRQWDWQGAKVTVAVSNEAGRIDLNFAADDVLSSFFQSQGLDASLAATMVKDLRALQNQRNQLNNKSPLLSSTEVGQISSWRIDKIPCWRDSFTVYSGAPQVNEKTASTAVKAALAWDREHRVGDPTTASGPSEESASAIGQVIRIRSSVLLADSGDASNAASATREWVGRLTGDRHKPMLTMKWGEGEGIPPSCEGRNLRD